MPKRTTILLEDDLYEMLIRESIKRFGNSKNLSKVINEILRNAFQRELVDIASLVYSKKLAKVKVEEFETFRRKLSRRFED